MNGTWRAECLVFGTDATSRQMAEYRADSRDSVYFHDPQVFRGLLVRGRREISARRELRDCLWRDGDAVYYQLGPIDPDSCASLFTGENGRWYENFASREMDFLKVDF